MAKIKYLVKSPLDHDNKRYAPGKTIEIEDTPETKEAIVQPLLAAGVIEPWKKAKEDAGGAAEK